VTHWRKLGDFGGDHIAAWDLGDRDYVLEIAEVRSEKLPGIAGEIKANRRPVLVFKGAKKTLIVNATIGKTIAGLYSNDVRAWVGRRVSLYATTTKARAGGMVDCVRVRNTIPDAPAVASFEGQPVDEEMQRRQKVGAGELLVEREAGEEG
jgi:hypothetical protein